MRGMNALMNIMKKNKTITQIDLDNKPKIRIVSVDIYFMCRFLHFRNNLYDKLYNNLYNLRYRQYNSH